MQEDRSVPAGPVQADAAAASAAALWSGLYGNLKQLARARLRRSGPLTVLDTTGLVNDAYVRIAAAQRPLHGGQGEFLAYASRVMRSVVIDLVRERRAERRGGGAQRITLNTEVMEKATAEDEPLLVDQALENLAKLEPRLCQVVEMRYFGGFTEAEIGAALGLTDRTVRRDWEKARLLLRSMLAE
jgi:RNA polymerase sigma factor (TIGR02999 family)